MNDANNSIPRIVFISHQADRSGAPLFLLTLVRWLRKSGAAEPSVVLLRDGPLVEDFQSVADTVVIRYFQGIEFADAIVRRVPWARGSLRLLIRHVLSIGFRFKLGRIVGRADWIYINTIASVEPVLGLSRLPPALLHLHERFVSLKFAVRLSAERLGLSETACLIRTMSLAELILVPSESNLQDLIRLGGDAGKVLVVPEAIEVNEVRSNASAPIADSRAEWLSKADVAIVSCGAVEWRKGTDLFLAVAAGLRARGVDARFLWVGVPWTSETVSLEKARFQWDIEKAGLDGIVETVPSVGDPSPYLRRADIFLLPSREDSFPIVAIEAASLGKPIVCFDSCGSTDMFKHGGGIAVPHLDLVAMCDALELLTRDPELRHRLGNEARLAAEGLDIAAIGGHIMEIMQRTLSGGMTGR